MRANTLAVVMVGGLLFVSGCAELQKAIQSDLAITIDAPEVITQNHDGRGTVTVRNTTSSKIDNLYVDISYMQRGTPVSLKDETFALAPQESKTIVFAVMSGDKGFNNLRVEAKWGDKKVTANRGYQVK